VQATSQGFFSRVKAPHPDGTAPAQLETVPGSLDMPSLRVGGKTLGLSLFWRTFFLLGLLLIGSILAWLQTFRALEYEPRAIQSAQQLASLVNLSRAALVHADAIQRVSLVKTLAEQEGVRITPREPADRFEPYGQDTQSNRVASELANRLGKGTLVARKVNGESGLWVGFTIESDAYWLLTDPSRITFATGRTWLIWLVTAAALSLTGAALIARLINRPLKQLSFAASRVRDGDFDASRLDEDVATSEIREVNIGFNRMAQQLAKIEADRAVMLAGISHDLRTPLARLRLETEMSVVDETAKMHMAADIDQLDAIIDKFLDYAKPDQVELEPVLLADVVEAASYVYSEAEDMHINISIPSDIYVMADEVELIRVVANLLENARRYGRTEGQDYSEVDVVAKEKEQRVLLKVRDHGKGVAPELIDKITTPFFRGDTARTAATGAGLGLAIVDKTVQRMGGVFALANAASGGLAAHVKLRRADKPAPRNSGH
jgi:two-component system, OmpR family, osmolarity sensor histidine kinase EnvZ